MTHCSVSSNSVHKQITQKSVHQITDPENKKCSHQISAEKSFPACQKGSCTFLSNFGGCKFQNSCGKSTFIQ